MCAVIQHILARGPAARPRCIPPALAPSGLTYPPKPSAAAEAQFQSQQTVSPVNHSQTFGRLHHRSGSLQAAPTPHGRGRSCPAGPQTNSWRPIPWRPLHGDQEGSFRAALAVDLPIDQGAFEPLWNPDHSMEANRPPIGCRQRVAAEPRPEQSRPGPHQRPCWIRGPFTGPTCFYLPSLSDFPMLVCASCNPANNCTLWLSPLR